MITKTRLAKILSLAVLINLAQPAQAISWSWITSLINQVKTSSLFTKLQENKTFIGIAGIVGLGLLHVYAYAARKNTDKPVDQNQQPISYIPASENQNAKEQVQPKEQVQQPAVKSEEPVSAKTQEPQPQQDQTKKWNTLVKENITNYDQQPIIYTNGKRYIHETFSIYIPTQQILILVKQGKIYKFDAEKKKLYFAENKKPNGMIAFIKSKNISINEIEEITINSWLEQINQEKKTKAFAAQQMKRIKKEQTSANNSVKQVIAQQQKPSPQQTAAIQQQQVLPSVESAAKPQKQHNAAYSQMIQGAQQIQKMNEERRKKKKQPAQENAESFIEVEPTVQLDIPTVKRELQERTKEANDILTQGIQVKTGMWSTKKIEFHLIKEENVTLLEDHLNNLKKVRQSLQASFEQGKQINLQVDKKNNSIYYQAETALNKLDQHIRLAEEHIQQVTKKQDPSLFDSFFKN